MGVEAHEDLWTALRNPDVVHGMCEDYRAGLTIDVEHDRADRAARRRVRCPVQSVWATQDDPDLFGPDPLALLPQAPQIRCLLGRYGVWPQAIKDQHHVEGRAAGLDEIGRGQHGGKRRNGSQAQPAPTNSM